jgi:2-oxoisovalerate dehydrogenase E1 component
MFMARTVDRVEMELVNRGEAFFHVGGAGHEAALALIPHLTSADFIHPHYRDKALLLGRGLPPDQYFHGLFGNAESSSLGRQMCSHLSAPELNVLTMAVPVGNNALPSVGVAHEILDRLSRSSTSTSTSTSIGTPTPPAEGCPLVVCS